MNTHKQQPWLGDPVDDKVSKRRDDLVAAAVADGRILAGKDASYWRDQLDEQPAVAERVLASLYATGRPGTPIEDDEWFPHCAKPTPAAPDASPNHRKAAASFTDDRLAS